MDDFEGGSDDGLGPNQSAIRDRSFNPWRYAATEKARAIIAEAVHMVESYEHHRAPRKRNRKAADKRTFELTIEAV